MPKQKLKARPRGRPLGRGKGKVKTNTKLSTCVTVYIDKPLVRRVDAEVKADGDKYPSRGAFIRWLIAKHFRVLTEYEHRRDHDPKQDGVRGRVRN